MGLSMTWLTLLGAWQFPHMTTHPLNNSSKTLVLQGHDDDIRCMAMHPNRYIVATGQVSSALDGSADPPFLSVWDTRDVLGTITKIRFPGEEGQGSR